MNALHKLLERLQRLLAAKDYENVVDEYKRNAAEDSRNSRARNKALKDKFKKGQM